MSLSTNIIILVIEIKKIQKGPKCTCTLCRLTKTLNKSYTHILTQKAFLVCAFLTPFPPTKYILRFIFLFNILIESGQRYSIDCDSNYSFIK